MPTEIKQLYTSGEFTITGLAGLVSSSSVAPTGWQSNLVDNTTTRFGSVLVYAKATQGITPTANRNAYVFLVRGELNGHVTDGQATGQALHNVKNANYMGAMSNTNNAVTNGVLYGEFLINEPGPRFGVTISHDTAVAFNTTGNTHYVRYVGINPESQ